MKVFLLEIYECYFPNHIKKKKRKSNSNYFGVFSLIIILEIANHNHASPLKLWQHSKLNIKSIVIFFQNLKHFVLRYKYIGAICNCIKKMHQKNLWFTPNLECFKKRHFSWKKQLFNKKFIKEFHKHTSRFFFHKIVYKIMYVLFSYLIQLRSIHKELGSGIKIYLYQVFHSIGWKSAG